MRLQRYPDGGAEWTLFVWSRHPAKSLTWTHSLAVTRWRHWTGWLPRVIWDRAGAQRGYGIMWASLQIELKRQRPMFRAATR